MLNRPLFIMPMTENPNVFFNTSEFAYDAAYTPPNGSPIQTKIILDHEIETGSLESYVPEQTTSMDLIKSDVGEPVRNASIVIEVGTYLVERKLSDDDFIVTVAVHKV